ncbi:hypothetical protein HK101_008799 [Irineochytrium annulatum]|nr:hypothetical protein HK101_008799 [Irineochytrium annulatum]
MTDATSMQTDPLAVTDELSSFVAAFVMKVWHQPPTWTPFHSRHRRAVHALPPFLASPPFAQAPADLAAWVHRVLTSSRIPVSILFLGLSLIHRLRQTLSGAPAPGTEFIAFTSALMLAMKTPAGADNTYTNAGWETISKVPVHLLNAMEIHFIVALHFDLWTKSPEYLRWLIYVEAAAVSHRRNLAAARDSVLVVVEAHRYVLVLPSPVPKASDAPSRISSGGYQPYHYQYASPPSSTQSSPSVSTSF